MASRIPRRPPQHVAPNPVKAAIAALGGMTRTIVATGISEATWHRWRRMGCIPQSATCLRVAALTGISPRSLAGLDESSAAA